MSSTHSNSPPPSTFFLLSIITLLCFPSITRSNDPCPYPCYPPPIGTTTPTTPTPSVTTSPPAPPQSGLSYPPPSGYVNPYNPTPPYGGGGYGVGSGGGGGFGTPPPPDPILPYFPFYYRKPPHKPEGSSASSTIMKKWTGMIATTSTLLSLFLLLFV